jgi:hypothetical protein
MGINIIGYGPKTASSPTSAINLPSGGTYVIPAGQYQLLLGAYTFLQWFDPITQLWRVFSSPAQSDSTIISSDGFNYRLANLTGTVVGASVTNAGTGYTNGIYPPASQLGTATAPSVTFAAGGGSVLAKGTLIVGGAINSTVTITTAGSGYTLPPTLVISNPPAGGVPATATCTISGGAINAVTVTNQGAGYTAAPTITVVNQALDTTGSGGVLTVNATLAGSGTVTAITVPINGVGMTSVPAITFAPASTTAATAIMCFTITAGVAQTSASNMGTGNIGFAGGNLAATQSTNTNPAITTGLFVPRIATTGFNTTAGGGITFNDSGLHQTIPAGIAYAVLSSGTISAAATAVAQTVGGVSDISYLSQY